MRKDEAEERCHRYPYGEAKLNPVTANSRAEHSPLAYELIHTAHFQL